MVGVGSQHHHLTRILQLCPVGRREELVPTFPEDPRGERMGTRGPSLVAPHATDRGEDDRERKGFA